MVMIGNLYHCSFRCLTSVSSRDPFFNSSFSVSLACFLDFVDSIYLASIFSLNYIQPKEVLFTVFDFLEYIF